MKRTDNAAFYTISDVISGTFEPGTVTYDLADGGVGLAPFHETEASIPQSIRSRLDMVKLALISGMLDPLDPEGVCLEIHQQYLPLSVR